MKRLIMLATLVAALVGTAVAFGDLLKVTDHGTTCSVITAADGGQAVNCIGKLSGLGSQTTTIDVSAGFTCTNKAGNTVVGQSSGTSGPIQPQNGQVTQRDHQFDVVEPVHARRRAYGDVRRLRDDQRLPRRRIGVHRVCPN